MTFLSKERKVQSGEAWMSAQSYNVNPNTVVEYNTTEPGLTIECGCVANGEFNSDILEISTDEDVARLREILGIYLDDREASTW